MTHATVCTGMLRRWMKVVVLAGLAGILGPFSSALAQSSTITLDAYLHGSGGTANPPTLTADLIPPLSLTAKTKDSAGLAFSGGNPWVALGTWTPPAGINGKATLTALTTAHLWMGFKSSGDVGGKVDVLVDVLVNGQVLSSGLTRCVSTLTASASTAQDISIALGSLPTTQLDTMTQPLALRVSTRMGTTASNTACGTKANVTGVRAYFDALTRASRLGVTIALPPPQPVILLPNPKTIQAGSTSSLLALLFPVPLQAMTLSVVSTATNVATAPSSVAVGIGQAVVSIPVTGVSAGTTQIKVTLNNKTITGTVRVVGGIATISSLTPSALSITQGGSGQLTVSLNATQATNTVVALSSSAGSIAAVPATVTVPAGQVSAAFNVAANTAGQADITATLNGTSATSHVTVTPALPTVVSLTPPASQLTLGATTPLTVTISAAQVGPTTVTLTATPSGVVSVPPSVIVPAGQTTASFTVTSVALGTAMVRATLGSSLAEAAIDVVPPVVALVDLQPASQSLVVGAIGTLTVTLNAAQSSPTDLALSVDQPTVLQIPATQSVTVPPNQTQATFTVTALATGSAQLTATLGSVSKQVTITVTPQPPQVLSLTPSPLAVVQGATGTLAVTLNAAQPTETVVPITTNNATIAGIPVSVTVPAGLTTASVSVSGLTIGTATITATLNGTATATVTIVPPPPVVTALAPIPPVTAPLTLAKGRTGVLQVTINRAPTDPTVITLQNSATSVVTVPPSVTVAAGQLTASFPVTTQTEGQATITASFNSTSAAAQVVVTAPEVESLTVAPAAPTAFAGESVPFTATGLFTDGSSQPLANDITWNSTNQSVAAIGSSGLATALTVGTTTIRATVTTSVGPVTGETTFTIQPAPLLTLSSTVTTVSVGTATTITVISAAPAGSSGLLVTLTQAGTGQVSMANSVTIPPSGTSASVVATGAAVGPLSITASAPGRMSATLALTVTPPPPAVGGFSPFAGKTGDQITVLGTNFINVQAVRFNGIAAGVFSVTSPTSLLVTVPAGAASGKITVVSATGQGVSTGDFAIIGLTALNLATSKVTLSVGESWQFRATGLFSDGTTRDLTSSVAWSSSNAGTASVSASGITQGLSQGVATITGAMAGFTISGALQVTTAPSQPLPPDPRLVAPPVSATIATTTIDSAAFLYSGATPIQTGVVPGAISPLRAAVLRGLINGRDGFPVPGVTITVLGHPEFGQTLTRSDGQFDLALSGGGPVTVQYSKTGYLTVQRQVTVPWQDYVVLPTVILLAADPAVTVVDLTLPTMKVARGSVSTDADGARQATILVPQGTSATMLLPGGGTQPLSALSIRATEYTVGATGRQAMPAELPAQSGYTYAVELSVDEAVAAGATRVSFSQPVVTYLENFLGIPVGTAVPQGYYDRQLGQWVAVPNGRVVKVVSVTGGLADIDTDGNGAADNGLGISTDERQRVATLYTVGQALWRMPVSHFSPYDWNFPITLSPLATAPNQPSPKQPDSQPKQEACAAGSIIHCTAQSLGESVGLSGTPLSLHYQSDRGHGRRAAYTLQIPVSGGTIPAPLKRIDLEIQIAGRVFTLQFPAQANQSYTFEWDGLDAYGRVVVGRQPVRTRLSYVYNSTYAEVFAGGGSGSGIGADVPAFGSFPGSQVALIGLGGEIERLQIAITQEWAGLLGAADLQSAGLGGWSLSSHHVYDFSGKELLLGTGEHRQVDALGETVTTIAGNGLSGFSGDGGPAIQAQIQPSDGGVAVAPDGSVYFADKFNARIRRIDPNGLITTAAGTVGSAFSGDGGLATASRIGQPEGLAIGADGSFYFGETATFVEGARYRVRKVSPTGIITTFAGSGVAGFSGDGGPATLAQFQQIRGLAVGPDGSVYVADSGNGRIRRVKPDGIIQTVANVTGVRGLAVGEDGSLYITVLLSNRVVRLAPNGVIQFVAGDGTSCLSATAACGDGGLALSAQLNSPFGVAVAGDGSLYIADSSTYRVRRVGPDGIITTVAGDGNNLFNGDGGLAPATQLQSPADVAVAPDGSVYIPLRQGARLRRLLPTLKGLQPGEFAVVAADGSERYVFDNRGRHLRTVDALTNSLRYTFGYESGGRLSTVTDGDGNVTLIERDGGGRAMAIVAAGGQRTTLTSDGNGLLTTITNPNGESVQLTYASAAGLLASLTDPRGNQHTYRYDSQGRLVKDTNAAEGFTALTRTEVPNGWQVELRTAMNRATTHRVELLPIGDQRVTLTAPSGLLTTTLIKPNGASTITAPDGTVSTQVQGPDPRFGMQAPLLKSLTVQTPVGLTSSLTTSRAVTLTNPNDPLSLATQTDTLVINGRQYQSTFTQAAKTLTTTTPAGRTSTVTLDAKGRVVQEQVTGLEPLAYVYDSLGRLSTITQGTGGNLRTSTLTYNSKNELTSIQDPLLRTVGFVYDLAGRITTQTLPDTRTIGYNYDANGNVTGITPPGKPVHQFTYTPVDLEQAYTPPDAGFAPRNTQYAYNLDRQLTTVTRPDGQTIQLGYEPTGGRLSTLTVPGAQVTTYAYDPTKGTLSSTTAPGSTLSYTYDGSLLKSTTWAGTVAGSVSRNYDNNFRTTSQSVNGASTITFGYDNDSLLTSAGALAIARSPLHGLISGTTVGTVTDSRSYSTFGELSVYTANVGGSPVFSTTFTRDNLGRITQKAETIGATTDTYDYSYDPAGRLMQVQKNGGVIEAYTYDSNGNRLTATVPPASAIGTYDAQDRLISYGQLQFTYTTNGELLTKSNPTLGQTASFTYDVLGNLKMVALPGGTTIEYVIDGQNRRIGKKVNGTLTTGWLYQNQLNPVAEIDGTGAIISRFVYGTKANVPDYLIKGGVTYRIVSDHLGSPRLVINTADGSLAQRIDYDAFGNITQDTNPGFQPFGFAGGLYDQHTGLTRFGARDYDAQVGRWTAKDPIGFRAFAENLYEYVESNPINFKDASGLFLFPWEPPVSVEPGRGGTKSEQAKVEQALKNVLGTPHGQEMEAAIRGPWYWHGSPIRIVLNHEGNTLCPVVPGEIILLDPSEPVTLLTTVGPEQASLERTIGHELGHAIYGTRDDGPGELNNVINHEWPITDALGQNRRTKYRFP